MAEPVTTITDFLLALLGWWCAWSLRQSGPKIELSRRLWAWGLGVQGTGALIGGLYHGLLPRLNPASEHLLWQATLVLLGAASSLLAGDLALAVLSARPARILLFALGIKFVAYAIWVWPRRDFFPALCDQAFTLVLIIMLLILGRQRIRSAIPYISFGLGAIVAGGLIQYFHLGLHPSFNHNDIYHLFGGLALWLFYRAGRRFYDPIAE